MWSTPAVKKQYNKMAVLHFFPVNSSLYILFSMIMQLLLSWIFLDKDFTFQSIYSIINTRFSIYFHSFLINKLNITIFLCSRVKCSCKVEDLERERGLISLFRCKKNFWKIWKTFSAKFVCFPPTRSGDGRMNPKKLTTPYNKPLKLLRTINL